jgi:5-methylthioadenosine/S-adenosylhomocysteine deaminase
LKANEADIDLVLINGVPRCGAPEAMRKLGADGESLTVGGTPKLLNFSQKSADPDVSPISLKRATETLTDALANLGNAVKAKALKLFEGAPQESPVWFLALDELANTGMDLRPHLSFQGRPTMAAAKGKAKAQPPLHPLKLDPLTVADDPSFIELIGRERNLPDFVREHLPSLF